MAFLKQALSEEDVKKLTVAGVKKAYNTLATDYNKLVNLDYVYCPCCGEFKSSTNFYSSNKTKSGLEHLGCKSCILDMGTDYDKKTGTRTDNKEKTIEVFRKLDLPFIESAYNSALDSVNEAVNEKNRGTAFQQLLVMVKSLPQWNTLEFKDSELLSDDSDPEYEQKEVKKTIKAGRKRFGNYPNEDLMFLENEYQDWISRYECNTKAQEEVFQSLSMLKLQKKQAIRDGRPTKELDKTYQDWLDTGNLKPKQNTMDTFSDAQTLGTLIQKYEETRPLPEIDPSLQDVDKIGLYIDAFYRGHASKMLGLKNTFSNLYEKVMSKYTVKPPEYDDETDSEVIFDKIFGSVDDE